MIYMQGNVTLPLDMQANGLGPKQYGTAIAMNGLLIILVTGRLNLHMPGKGLQRVIDHQIVHAELQRDHEYEQHV